MSGPQVISPRTLRVVKVGGSLLGEPWLAERLQRWLDEQSPATTVLIAGGGTLVDVIRQTQAIHDLDDASAHWQAIDAMRVTARLIAVLLPNAEQTTELFDIRSNHFAVPPCSPQLLWVLDTAQLLRNEFETGVQTLPCGWHVTSDSIAAWMAVELAADELVLLKSALPTEAACDVESLVREGYVDEYFPHVIGSRPLRLVDLHSVAMPEQVVVLGPDEFIVRGAQAQEASDHA